MILVALTYFIMTELVLYKKSLKMEVLKVKGVMLEMQKYMALKL